MTDKTDDELFLREVAAFASDLGVASMASKLLALIKRLDAPGPRLTEEELKFTENVRSGHFIEDRDATIQLQLKIIDRLSAQPKETGKVCNGPSCQINKQCMSPNLCPFDQIAPEKAEGETP